MIWEKIIAVICILLGLYQFYASYHAFKDVTKHGSKHTSPFFAFADFYGYFFGSLLIVMAVRLLIGVLD